ncbi:MAG: (2Fe-2S)-binding protein [Deltaproteobacteria bacterium]|nr:(2Fe-2S)-binding protein [Deltaproteobacteria bacterium]
MIVCSCKAVTDTRIRDEVRAGARTPQEVAARLGAGTDCGSCRNLLALIVKQAQSQEPSAQVDASAPLSWRHLRDALAGA